MQARKIIIIYSQKRNISRNRRTLSLVYKISRPRLYQDKKLMLKNQREGLSFMLSLEIITGTRRIAAHI